MMSSLNLSDIIYNVKFQRDIHFTELPKRVTEDIGQELLLQHCQLSPGHAPNHQHEDAECGDEVTPPV